MRSISLLILRFSSKFFIFLPVLLSSCSEKQPDAGLVALQRFQCGACHVIPGVTGARGQVGPPLDDYARRVYIAGKLPRDEALLARWIADAPSLSPGTAMPKIPMTDTEARAMAAFLYRVR
jgi:cytochrome c1